MPYNRGILRWRVRNRDLTLKIRCQKMRFAHYGIYTVIVISSPVHGVLTKTLQFERLYFRQEFAKCNIDNTANITLL